MTTYGATDTTSISLSPVFAGEVSVRHIISLVGIYVSKAIYNLVIEGVSALTGYEQLILTEINLLCILCILRIFETHI